ncbi:MAG: 50S ribosomal protein L11 methyltransferase [Clostridiales Family XIII bacterium]|jgi:ribosomal protein L11 methyltransferase|nr:50S ribosomal protein L11 methyltransferase [Clostridiales Family XIII bacterium]
MEYLEVKIHVSTVGAEVITALLESRGVSAVSLEDPKDIADLLGRESGYVWDYCDPNLFDYTGGEAVLTFYLEQSPDSAEFLSEIRRELAKLVIDADAGVFGSDFSFGSLKVENAIRSDEEWKDNWKAYFKPFCLTENIWVRPSWEVFKPENDDIRIITLDPGMAFGTGRHETTAMCAELLSRALKPGMSVMDVGCGSGILLITACLLGAKDTLGIEIDEDAIGVARENININGLEDKAKVVKGDLLEDNERKADIITANLTVDLIARLAGDAAAHLNLGGRLIVSGVLSSKKALAEAALEENGFDIIDAIECGEWLALAALPRSVAVEPPPERMTGIGHE